MRKLIIFFLFFSFNFFSRAQDSTLNEYTGKYKFPSGSMVPEVDITLSDNILSITAVLGLASMEKVSRDTFMIPTYGNALVFFYRNTDNKVASIKIDTGNDVMEGKKEGVGAAWIRNYFWYDPFASLVKK